MFRSLCCAWQEKPATSEVTTFTVFFMAFTAVVGKDLMAMSNDSLSQMDDQTILSTYTDRRTEKQKESDQIANFVDEIVMDADLPPSPSRERKERQMHSPPKVTQVRNRFNDKLSTLKIMEAKETARAELGIAFEMLKMMKERALRADPEAYQCLIDACGRCGDTDRATELLSRMHEDGIVADGVVYSSLVAAFSAENAWKQASGEAREELPGEYMTRFYHSPSIEPFLILTLPSYSSCTFYRMGEGSIAGYGLEHAEKSKALVH